MANKWEILHSSEAGDYRVFKVKKDRKKIEEDGSVIEHDFYTLDCEDWINIIPLTANNEVVFIRQFRHGSNEMSLEVPAGVVEDYDDSPADTARREMIEETGYDSDNIVKLGVVRPNPAIINNRGHVFVAFDSVEADYQNLDESEFIETELIPLEKVGEMILSGEIDHALVIATFSLLNLYLNNKKA